jgi:hypothetical protein
LEIQTGGLKSQRTAPALPASKSTIFSTAAASPHPLSLARLFGLDALSSLYAGERYKAQESILLLLRFVISPFITISCHQAFTL